MARLAKTLSVLAALFAVALFTAYVSRDALATRYVAYEIEHDPDLRCTPLPRVSLAASLQSMTVGPLDCRIEKGPISRVRTEGDTEVSLSGLTPRVVHVRSALMDQRERDVSRAECNTLGELANALGGVTDSLLVGLVDGAEMYGADEHVTLIDKLTTRRGGKPESVMHAVRTSTEEGWNRTQAKRVLAPGPELVTVTDFDMRVKPDEGALAARVHVGEAGPDDAPALGVLLRASALTKRTPRCSLELTRATARELGQL